jgi:hypothetical protein
MQAVTTRWAPALGGSPSFITTCTVTVPGGDAVTVPLERQGTLSVDGTSRARRRMDGIRLTGGKSVYEMAATPGALFEVMDGQYYGSGAPEMIPIFTGESVSPSQDFGGGFVSAGLVDLSIWLARTRFKRPFVAAAGSTRIAVMTAAVQTARPGTAVENLSTDTGALASQTVWTEGPLDVIDDLTTDGGTTGHFDPDGVFRFRDLPLPNAPAVARVTAGFGGTLEDATRTRALDKLYNGVIVRPAATNKNQTWRQQEAWVTDLSDPRHPNYIGECPYFVTAPTALTAAAAISIAKRRLMSLLGPTESLAITAIANSALDADDPISIVTPAVGLEPSDGFVHFIRSFSLDLGRRSMSIVTASQTVLNV